MQRKLGVLSCIMVLMVGCPGMMDRDMGARDREARIEGYFWVLRVQDPQLLRALLKRMPKGANLHSHLSGAVKTELLIAWGAEDGLCIDTVTFTATLPPCEAELVPLTDAFDDPVLYNQVLAAWSMEGFQGTLLEAHQHFFDTFGKFGATISDARTDDAIADVLATAGANNQRYIELMLGFNSSTVGRRAARYILPGDPWDEAYLLEKRRQLLTDPVFIQTLSTTQAFIDTLLLGARALLGCSTLTPDPGCNVEVRFQLSANRTNDRGFVFAQWVYAYELARVAPLVLGVNLVSPEEHPNSLLYYDDEMFALDVLRRLNQGEPGRRPVHIALHAGELIPEVLPATPEGQRHLIFHIRRAVEVAHAERIGHGVDVLFETDSNGVGDLLLDMRTADVMVEICLSSNAVLLGKEGMDHPLHTYLRHKVPVALATDDQGVFRTNITDEYVRAITDQQLDYRTLKDMVRTGLEHSFLPGASLWKVPSQYNQVTDACDDSELGSPHQSPACAQLLADSERAAQQWRLEADFTVFEDAVLAGIHAATAP